MPNDKKIKDKRAPDEPDIGSVLGASVAVAKRGLLRSFEMHHRNGMVRVAMTLDEPLNDVDDQMIKELSTRIREYKKAWAVWKANFRKGNFRQNGGTNV